MNSITGIAPRTRKARGQGAERRNEILQAAKRLFIEQGVQHVTMRGIAQAVGVSATALYVYFPDKDAIMRAIAVESFLLLREQHEAILRPDATPEQNLRAGARVYINFARAHPDEYCLVFLRTGRKDEPDYCKEIEEAEQGFCVLLDGVQALIDSGRCQGEPALLLAETFWACLHGLAALLVTFPEALESDHEQLIEQVIETAIAGLCRNMVN